MKAIPTTYRGTPFRSRLEAQWAEFFDMLGLAWDYEPEGYTNGKINYLPDFWLPSALHRGKEEGGLFFEVKPCSPLAGEIDKAIMLAGGSGKPVYVVAKSPRTPDFENLHEYVRDGDRSYEDQYHCFARCSGCGAVSLGWHEGSEHPCPCGRDGLNAYDALLQSARVSFPRLGRWSAAA